jgi:hypothetical protein
MKMKVELKNVKLYAGLSQETVAFAATLYIDGKKVGKASNAGHGGSNDVDVHGEDGRLDRDLFQKLETEAETHTWEYEGETHPHSLDSYIGELVDDAQEQRDLKRKCRTQTLFRIPTETYQNGEFHVMKRKYDQSVKSYLVKSYGDKVEIINERVRV